MPRGCSGGTRGGGAGRGGGGCGGGPCGVPSRASSEFAAVEGALLKYQTYPEAVKDAWEELREHRDELLRTAKDTLNGLLETHVLEATDETNRTKSVPATPAPKRGKGGGKLAKAPYTLP